MTSFSKSRLLSVKLFRALNLTGWLGLALGAFGQMPMDKARVTIVAMDSFGSSFEKVRIISFKNSNGRDFADGFVGSVANSLPFGEYMARLQIESGGWMTRKVIVSRQDCILIFADNPLTVESRTGHEPVISGTVFNVPLKVERPMWIKICDLYLDGCEVAEVDKSNKFKFTNLIPASLVISLLSKSGELLTERLDVKSRSARLSLDLKRSGRDRLRLEAP